MIYIEQKLYPLAEEDLKQCINIKYKTRVFSIEKVNEVLNQIAGINGNHLQVTFNLLIFSKWKTRVFLM